MVKGTGGIKSGLSRPALIVERSVFSCRELCNVRNNVPKTTSPKEMWTIKGRPRAHVSVSAAEAFAVERNEDTQGEECRIPGEGVSGVGEEILGYAYLGERILCKHSNLPIAILSPLRTIHYRFVLSTCGGG